MSAMESAMKNRLHVTAITIAVAAALGSGAAAEEKYQKLTGPQIRAKLAGMEVTDEVH